MRYVSEGCFDLTGYQAESLLQNRILSFNQVIAPEYREPIREEWKQILTSRQPFNYEYEIITADGTRKWVLEMGEGIFNDQGEVEALEGLIIDISDRKAVESALKYNNEHDRYTGLFNRRYLESLLKKDAGLNVNYKRAVVCIDLRAVQTLTAAYGFHYTQVLIWKAAEALNRHCTDQRFLFQTYEHRFVFYLKDYKSREELHQFCQAVSDTLVDLLAVERLNGGIGVLEINQEFGQDVDLLLKNLLIAAERAFHSDQGDFTICYFDKEMEAQIIRKEEILRELSAVTSDEGDDGGLFLQFQPILDLKTDQICAFEALARFNSSIHGLVSPLEFIPLAEKTKLIIPLGWKIIRQALRFLKSLDDQGHGDITVSINISAIQLFKGDFCQQLFTLIDEIQVDPERIGLEITESILASNFREINTIISELKDYGLYIALDDFGTGYSTLARERELNVNCLKIDKCFVDKLLVINPETTITSDIISMAHKLGHCTIAEGVECEEQKQYLIGCGCDKIQGYLVSRPLDEAVAIEFLQASDA